MKVLAIIVSYNFERWIDRCLPTLLVSEEPVDILVIDNCSTDDTVERIKRMYPSVRLLVNEHNLGFGKANNIGLSLAIDEHYEYVFLINQDAWVSRVSIGNMIKAAESEQMKAVISPVHLNGAGEQLDHGFATYINKTSIWEVYEQRDTIQVDFINAAFWFIPIDIVKRVGGFSPLFYHYGEDKDYANRLKFHHYAFGYTSSATGYHDRAYRISSFIDIERAEYVYFLSEYANINYTLGKAFLKSIIASTFKGLKCLFKADWQMALAYYKMAFKLLCNTAAVRRIRKQTKKEGRSFI